MTFAPAPANDFRQFYQAYYQRCQTRCPKIVAVAAKWAFADLIPGLSDFDTRFIVNDTMTTADWHHMSIQVGQVHTELARAVPHWARNLEHLPGLNLTVKEICHPLFFYPEFQQWTFYEGDPTALRQIQAALATHSWGARDELYHLKKIATFTGPYQRGIDPAVNMGPWESKYPLHSRYMHYFAPPVQAAVSLKLRRNVRGKLEALRLAQDLFPQPEVITHIFATLDQHYEITGDYQEPRLTEIERLLETYLDTMWQSLAADTSLVKVAPGDDRPRIQQKVASIPVDPVETFFEGVKFARLMKGRLLFYAQEIPWFDSIFLIHNELNRIVANLYAKPLSTYGKARFGANLTAEEVLARVRGGLLSDAHGQAFRTFAELAKSPIPRGNEKALARRVAEVYDLVLDALEVLSADLLRMVESRQGTLADAGHR